MILKDYLHALKFEQKTPYQFHGDSYIVINVLDSDSYGFEVWSITNKRHDEVVFRGRIRSIEEFEKVMSLVKEDYDLTEDEREKLIDIL